MGRRRVRRGAVGALAVLAGVTAPAGTAVAGASSYQAAFTTYEAPGGAATAGQRVIALTFDDGPSQYTPQVLSVLEQYHVPATFFEIGYEVAELPGVTQMVVPPATRSRTTPGTIPT